MLRRRDVVVGGGAATLFPTGSWCARPDPASFALDAAARLPPGEALDILAAIDVTHLSPARRLDVLTARAGLAIDVRLLTNPNDLAVRIARSLGTVVTIEAARAELQRTMARLQAEADRCLDEVGMTGGSVGDRYRRLFDDVRYLPDDGAAGRDAALAAMRAALGRAQALTRQLLPETPAWALACDVRALRTAEIASGKSGFREVPTPLRAGTYVVDLADIRRRPFWTLPGVVVHELVPGHMIQLGIEGVAPPHPLRVTYAAAFVEGWGIFAETMAAKAGMFATPLDRLGSLHWLIFRAARGLADIGVNAAGWSIERAKAQFSEWLGVPAYFAPFDTDLARIAREPGVRAAEALAWLALARCARRSTAARHLWLAAVLRDGRKRTELLP